MFGTLGRTFNKILRNFRYTFTFSGYRGGLFTRNILS